jgi:cob(I)alamin adenosyltransferase
MKIYTRKGDGGETGLYGGRRLSKDDVRIEAYGTLDELNSWIGLLMNEGLETKEIDRFTLVQEELFAMGSYLAADPDKENLSLPRLNEDLIRELEGWIDEMDGQLPEMRTFILPGGNRVVSYCHIARTVCRKAERRVITLAREEEVHPQIVPFLNRLSDQLFTFSRLLALRTGAIERPWNPAY